MKAYYSNGCGYSQGHTWIPHEGRWFICEFKQFRLKNLVSFFAVVDDFGNLTEVET